MNNLKNNALAQFSSSRRNCERNHCFQTEPGCLELCCVRSKKKKKRVECGGGVLGLGHHFPGRRENNEMGDSNSGLEA
jgi:hypothetical protein